MSYQLNKTDGTILTELIDGQIDRNSTNLVLVGRNFTGFGEFINENFIRLLENFSNTAAPSNPLTGQLWWDVSEQRLKVYDGAVWKASGGPFVQGTRPTMVAGDLWIDNLNNQVYAFDGTDLILIGPIYTETQGLSGFQVDSILDLQSRSRTVIKLFIGNALVGVFSNLTFTPIFTQRILELVTEDNPNGIIFEGFNIVNKSTFKLFGIAEGANSLITEAGTVVTAEQFLPSDRDGVTVGTLTIQNAGGLTIGLSQNNVQRVIGQRFFIENQLRDHDLSLRVRSSKFQSLIVDAVYVDAERGRVGIFTTNRLPQATLDVEGDLRVTGDLLIEGQTTTIETATLRVEDKNIELAYTSDSTPINDAGATGGGITLLSSNGNKTFQWELATNSWTSNVNVDLASSSDSYKIAGSTKLTNTSLTNIQFAPNLTQIGTLEFLNVDSINIDNNTISSSIAMGLVATAGVNITAGGNIAIQDNRKITGLATPTDNQDAANKIYVDTQIATETIVFSLDITALGSGTTLVNNVRGILQTLYPVTSLDAGKVARIHTVSYAGATVSGIIVDIADNVPNTGQVLTVEKTDVDANGTLNRSVVRDIAFTNPASGVVDLTPIRGTIVYQSNGTTWEFVSNDPYP
jgi:Ni,Fe-hydrogenase maturation factor